MFFDKYLRHVAVVFSSGRGNIEEIKRESRLRTALLVKAKKNLYHKIEVKTMRFLSLSDATSLRR